LTYKKLYKDRETKLRSESRTERSGMNTTKREKVMETKTKKWILQRHKSNNEEERK
jgi:hypothetical protein